MVQLNVDRLNKRADRNLSPAAALVETEVKHQSTQLEISRGGKRRAGPGVRAVSDLSQHPEDTRPIPLTVSAPMNKQNLHQSSRQVESG